MFCGDIFAQWDKYPTYPAYKDMMEKFGTDYPELCKIVEIGESVQGRKLLAAKISDNVDTEEKEPCFLYHATIHGDETLGYMLMLNLIDYLLTNYGTDALVTKLVDNIEIYIDPLVNPDGTYNGGSINQCQRYNANGKDLNRNWPYKSAQGIQPYGLYDSLELEVKALKDLFESDNFVMSAALHGGMESVAYPVGKHPTSIADTTWWKYVCTMYVNTANAIAGMGYLEVFPDSFALAQSGTWMYYAIYFQHCRDITLELSIGKFLPENQLVTHWNYNYVSILNLIEQVLYGIQGTVTDSLTGDPLNAKVFVENHDMDSSIVYSHLPYGDYYRPIYEGTYDVTFSCDGYYSKTIKDVQVENNKATILDVKLRKIQIGIIPKINNLKDFSSNSFPGVKKIEIYDLMGKKVKTLPATAKINWKEGNGIYIVRLVGKGINRQFKVMLTK